ncbi:MAG TPA: glycosyltransferase [Vicinamibacterales bacterium]|nr:glycosyltransferase [Vicinamibacterales bacterium]
MKVLLAPHGTRGDVQPMVALALALRARGHVVSFVAPSNFAPWIRSFGFAFESDGIDVAGMLRAHGMHFDSMRWQMQYLTRVMIPALFETVPRAMPDAEVIVGAGVQLAAASVAEQRGVPYATAMFCPCAVPSSATPPPTARTQTFPHWLNRLLWDVGLPLAGLALLRPLNAGRAALGLPALAAPFGYLAGHRILVAADRDLGPLGDDAPETAVATDAWILDDTSEAIDESVDRFLDREPPVVYVGFGSMIEKNAPELASAAIAAVHSVGCRALIGSGWAGLGRDGDSDDDGLLVTDTLPHGSVFPRVAAVVHHGGAGTTTAAARAGVPQVVLPHILDQFYWAHRVEKMGLGPRGLPVDLVTADVLAARLDAAVNDERIAARAAALGRSIAGRDGAPDAVDQLERLAALHSDR